MQVWRNWQTRQIQVLVIAISCGFKSHHLHHEKRHRLVSFFNEVAHAGLMKE